MAPRPTFPTAFWELIKIAPTPIANPIPPLSSTTSFATRTAPPLKTLIRPWDACATTITVLAPSSSLDLDASITPTPRIFTCPATVTWTADAALFTGNLGNVTPADTDSATGDGIEDEGFDFRDIPKWEAALVAFAIVGAAILVILVVVGVRCWQDRRARRKRGKGKGRALETVIDMGRFEGQVVGTIDLGSDASEAKGVMDEKGEDRRGKQYLYGGQMLEEKDVSDYAEGMKGRF